MLVLSDVIKYVEMESLKKIYAMIVIILMGMVVRVHVMLKTTTNAILLPQQLALPAAITLEISL